MKKVMIVTTLIVLGLSAVAWAHRGPDFDPLFQKWNLSEPQRQELQGYMEQHREAVKKLYQEHRAQMQELREQHHQNLSKVLSEEQMKELEDSMKERHGKRGHRGHHGDHGHHKGGDEKPAQ